MNTSLIAMLVALLAGVLLVVSLGGLNLLLGGVDWFIGKPKLTFLKTTLGKQGFAFRFNFNPDKQPASFDHVKLRMFNPFGTPTQVELNQQFPATNQPFYQDLDFGPGLTKLLQADGLSQSFVQVEIYSSKSGITHQYDMKGVKFKQSLEQAQANEKTVSELQTEQKKKSQPLLKFSGVPKDMVAPPSEKALRPTLKIATNPDFEGELAAAGGLAATAPAAVPNFSVKKVWIEPGCIVCDACETIYPEVFEVTADTCIIRPNPPLDDGLKIQEAAEACPVEVIKFNAA